MRIARTWRRAGFRAGVFVMAGAIGAAVAPAAFGDGRPPETVFSVATKADGTVAVRMNGQVAPDWLQINVRATDAADAATLYSTRDVTNGIIGGSDYATTSARVVLPAGTPYGSYPIDVDFQLPGGDVQHWSAAGHAAGNWLDYRKHASVTSATFDRASTDWDHRTATLTGHVEVLDPVTGAKSPAPAGTSVDVRYQVGWASQWTGTSGEDVTTDADGDFSYTSAPGGDVLGYVQALASADITPGDWAEVRLPVVVSQYRITAVPRPAVLYRGDRFAAEGKVERLTADGWKPFAGAAVDVATRMPDYDQGYPESVITSGAAKADGTYSFPITAKQTTTLYTYVYPSPYLSPVVATSTVSTTAGSITLPKFTIDQDATVKTTGRLNGDCAHQTLDFQFSPNGTTGWRTIAHTVTGAATGGYCSYYIAANGGWDGWYRVRHAATSQMVTVQTQTPRLRRTRTQMSIAVSSTHPAYGTTYTISGVVIQLTGAGWVHENKAHVQLYFRAKGDTLWGGAVGLDAYTDAAGRYSFRMEAGRYGSGSWTAALLPDSTHFSTGAGYVTVNDA
ncbi:hypothetical protein [Streptomyces sp. CA-111067]|uniref:hypothetical protein n=1 Tax=Streptomyces sp. CA-111067 TaxID=3240046 RepID=UPI003D97E899